MHSTKYTNRDHDNNAISEPQLKMVHNYIRYTKHVFEVCSIAIHIDILCIEILILYMHM